MALAEVQTQIAALHREDAERIIDKSRKYPLVVVTGPFRMGKTSSLIPNMVDYGKIKGMHPQVYNFQGSEYYPKEFGEQVDLLGDKLLTLPNNRVLIGDEAGAITSYGPQHVDMVLKKTGETDTAVVSVIAYKTGDTNPRDVASKKWLEAQYGSTSPEEAVVHLTAKYLPRQLAEDLLNHGSSGCFTEEQIADLLGFLPHHPWILDSVSDHISFEYAKKFILANAYSWEMSGLITNEQWGQIISHAAEDPKVEAVPDPSPKGTHNWLDHPRHKGLTQEEISIDNTFGEVAKFRAGEFYQQARPRIERLHNLERQGNETFEERQAIYIELLQQYGKVVFGVDVKEIEKVPLELSRFATEKSQIRHFSTKRGDPTLFDRRTFQMIVKLPSGRAKWSIFQAGPIG
jgi:hypothetical protein